MGKNNNTQNNNEESQAGLHGGDEKQTGTTGDKAGDKVTSTVGTDVKDTGLIKIKARSLTKKGYYYRAGLSFIVSHKEYSVTADILKVLEADKWLEVEVLK